MTITDCINFQPFDIRFLCLTRKEITYCLHVSNPVLFAWKDATPYAPYTGDTICILNGQMDLLKSGHKLISFVRVDGKYYIVVMSYEITFNIQITRSDYFQIEDIVLYNSNSANRKMCLDVMYDILSTTLPNENPIKKIIDNLEIICF